MAGIDTVKLTLAGDEYRGGFSHIPPLLENRGTRSGRVNDMEYCYEYGWLGNLNVRVHRGCVVVEGSLPRWYLGDNLQTLTRGAVRDAVCKLSDTLHLPMALARVGRLDIGGNIITKYAPYLYYQYMGQMARYKRTETDGEGVMYRTGGGVLEFVLYDKLLEVLRDGGEIPEWCEGRNVLRLERRTMKIDKKTAGRFGVFQVLGRTLYDENFYVSAMKDYKATYDGIKKTHGGKFKKEMDMKTKRELLYHLAKIGFLHEYGGNVALLTSQIENERVRGGLTSKQKSDMVKCVMELDGMGEGTGVVGCVEELDFKVKRDLVKFP